MRPLYHHFFLSISSLLFYIFFLYKKTPPVGLEPTTLRLKAARSTDWARKATDITSLFYLCSFYHSFHTYTYSCTSIYTFDLLIHPYTSIHIYIYTYIYTYIHTRPYMYTYTYTSIHTVIVFSFCPIHVHTYILSYLLLSFTYFIFLIRFLTYIFLLFHICLTYVCSSFLSFSFLSWMTTWPSGLRRVTRNHFSSGGVGSNPAVVVFSTFISFSFFYKKMVLPRFELGSREPESHMLPLHHATFISSLFSLYIFFTILYFFSL